MLSWRETVPLTFYFLLLPSTIEKGVRRRVTSEPDEDESKGETSIFGYGICLLANHSYTKNFGDKIFPNRRYHYSMSDK